MTGYVPWNPAAAGAVAGLLALVLAVGYGITRLERPLAGTIAAWGLVTAAVLLTEHLTRFEPAGVRMLLIILTMLLGLKPLVTVREQAAGRAQPHTLGWLLFATAWPGMRPSTFADVPGSPRPVRSLLYQGVMNLLAGVILFLMSWMIVQRAPGSVPSPLRLLMVSALLLPALSLILHFGLFNLLAGLWRRIGGDCHALFRAPLRSTSLTEFWGRRWNLAFSEMTALTVYRPLRRLTGNRLASVAAFLFSGFLHELAISLPVRQGYGLPMLYFVLHAVAMQIETFLADHGKPINSSRLAGRCWTAAWLVLPLPLLFHLPFLRGCAWPLLGLNLPG